MRFNTVLPTANDLALGSTDGNVIADYDKFDAVRLVWVKSGVLLLGETKVENIASVVSVGGD